MLSTTLKGLAAHKRRLVGTVLSIVLGVGFLAGTFILTDTVGRTFHDLFGSVYRGTDAYVRGPEQFNADFNAARARLPEQLVQQVAQADGVAAAEANIQGNAVIIGSNGKPIGTSAGPPRFGGYWQSNATLNPFKLAAGRAPKSDDEVVIDRASAKKGKLGLGDRVNIVGQKQQRFRVVGIATFGTADSPAGATYALFTLRSSQSMLGEPGKVDGIQVLADPGVSQADVVTRIKQVVPPFGPQVITGSKLLKEQQDQFKTALNIFNRILLVFAFVAVFVSCFIIYNTFSVIVAQRTRELAMMRAVGATGGQVRLSVLLEALMVGFAASIVGIGVGMGIALLLRSLFSATGASLPGGSLVLLPKTIIISMLVGTVITTLSAVLPARRAARVAPIAAMRDVAVDRSGRSIVRIVIGVLVVALSVASLLSGLRGGDNALSKVGFGMIGTLIGIIVLGPVLAGGLTRSIGAPLPRLAGISGQLARENSRRNPGRTASTASALMIGVALVTFVTVFAGSFVASNNRTIDRQFQGDFTVTSGSGQGPVSGGLPTDLATKVAQLPAVAAATAVRVSFAGVGVQNQGRLIYGVDTKTLSRFVKVGVAQGSLTKLGADGIAVRDEVASDHGYRLGSTVPIRFVKTGRQQLTVRAIFTNRNLTGPSTQSDYVLDLAGFARNADLQLDQQILVKLAPGVSTDQGRRQLDRVTRPYPTAEVFDRQQFKDSQAQQVQLALALIYGLLGLAVVIAILGIANTLSLSTIERIREFGLLRAVGMTRRQLRRTMLLEAVIIALLGTTIGLVVGLGFGAAVVQALKDQGIDVFSVPITSLAILVLVAAVAALLASFFPARRAARLNVIEAVAS